MIDLEIIWRKAAGRAVRRLALAALVIGAIVILSLSQIIYRRWILEDRRDLPDRVADIERRVKVLESRRLDVVVNVGPEGRAE